LDVVRVQDVGLAETPDPVILAWAAGEERILLTHDRETSPALPTTAFAPEIRCPASFSSAITCPRAKPSNNCLWPLNASISRTAETKCIISLSE
jgi:hypothetical protein